MSTDQPELAVFIDRDRETAAEPERQWTPGQRKRQCDCGAFVTADFVRVFGTDGRAHACLECLNQRAISAGAAADPSLARRFRDDLTDNQRNCDNSPGVPGNEQ